MYKYRIYTEHFVNIDLSSLSMYQILVLIKTDFKSSSKWLYEKALQNFEPYKAFFTWNFERKIPTFPEHTIANVMVYQRPAFDMCVSGKTSALLNEHKGFLSPISLILRCETSNRKCSKRQKIPWDASWYLWNTSSYLRMPCLRNLVQLGIP